MVNDVLAMCSLNARLVEEVVLCHTKHLLHFNASSAVCVVEALQAED